MLTLAGCGDGDGSADASAGARLEAAAQAAGLIPAGDGPLTGTWVRDGDRMCVAAPTASGAGQRVGIVQDYGRDNGCVASGTVRHDGGELVFDLGTCRVRARVDGEELVFPADLDSACAALCRGNASLAAMRVEQVSQSSAEASTLRDAAGQPLCRS